MRDGGRYYAAFTPLDGGEWGDMLFGVTRPSSRPDGRRCVHWGQLTGHDDSPSAPCVEDGSCFFRTGQGFRDENVIGVGSHPYMHRLRDDGTETVGLLLDLDAGTMTAYLNGRLLEVMATGLTGEYTWAVSLDQGYDTGVVRVEVGPPHFRPYGPFRPAGLLPTETYNPDSPWVAVVYVNPTDPDSGVRYYVDPDSDELAWSMPSEGVCRFEEEFFVDFDD